MTTPDPNALKYKALREDLHRRYDHALPGEDIDRVLDDLIERHKSEASVHTFIPVIVEREATAAIEERAWSEGAETRRQEILFVCEYNTGRSQIASVVGRHFAGDQALIRSVGPKPTKIANPEIIRQLNARGYDTSLVYPKELTSRTIYDSDTVILIGGSELDAWRDRATERWDVRDPEAMDSDGVAAVIDDISDRVFGLLEQQGIDLQR